MGVEKVDQASKVEDKPGFLRIPHPNDPAQSAFHVEEALPYEVIPPEVPNKIGENGELLIETKSDYVLWIEITEPFRDYIRQKDEWALNSIFRGFNLLSRALLGFPVRQTYSWQIPAFPGFDHKNQIPKKWEPVSDSPQLQERVFKKALKYLYPDLDV